MNRFLLVVVTLTLAMPFGMEIGVLASSEQVQAGGRRMAPQRSRSAGQRNRRGGPPEAGAATTVQQVERMWDTYVAAQARTSLGLDNEEQFQRFGAQLQQLQNLRRRLQRQQNILRRELNQLVASGQAMDRAAVTAKLAEYDGFGVRSAQQVRRAYAAIDGLLNLRQRVRFRTFESRMAQRKLELLAEARVNARGRGPGGTPRPVNRR